MTHWWHSRRFGLKVHASLAAVPAWAPRGQSADWYRAHIGDRVSNTLLQISPLAETLAHHSRRWSHIDAYDDFLPFLNFDQFDADAVVDLAREAGMSYLVATAKHHDGWCWWDAPNTDRSLAAVGPKRNLIGELATACERGDTMFGATYSLLDWGDPRHPGADYVNDVVHPHVHDLVDRYGVQIMRGDGHWGASGEHWRSDELLSSLLRHHPGLIINDRFWSDRATMRTHEFEMPDSAQAGDWEFVTPLGDSHGHNRTEPAERTLTAAALVALLTEVVAKGGHLLVAVGPDSTGTIPSMHRSVLREAGEWVRANDELIDRSEPWDTWGDNECRFMVLNGVLQALDISGSGIFAALARSSHPVVAVTDEAGELVAFDQDHRGLRIDRGTARRNFQRRRPAARYRIELAPAEAVPVSLFTTHRDAATPLADAIGEASSGDLVQLGEGRYLGPARIPDGVTVRGLGSHRTIIDGLESEAVALGRNSRLEHCDLRGGRQRIAWLPRLSVRIVGDGASMLACRVDGHVRIDHADRVRLGSCDLNGLVANDGDEIEVIRCTFDGMGWDCAVDISNGSGHLIESCDSTGALQAIRLTQTVNATIRGNTLSARWWAVQLIDTELTTVIANAVERTMRAVDVDGGVGNTVTGNAVFDGDSGCVVQRGAADTEVSGNHWERCRVGYFAWDAGPTRLRDNALVDLDEADQIVGP